MVAPLSRSGDSKEEHSAQFKLDEDGTLSGSVRMTWTGHLAVKRRAALFRKSAAEREEYIKDEMKDQFGSPEINDIKWDGIDDSERPVSVSFAMKATGYVQKTGKRIFVQPAVFQRAFAARFPNSTRVYPVYFQYAWSEVDDISIEVPAGYEFDHPDIPPSIKAGDTVDWKVTARIEGKTKLVYERRFSFGDDGNLVLPVTAYANVKKVFDAIHEGDDHTFALKQAVAQ